MATNVPGSADTFTGQPNRNQNQADTLGLVSRESLGKRVAEFHRKGLNRRRFRDLTAEKYLLHIDGEGDAQWADLYNGERIEVPANLTGSPRVQHNLLRPMVDNMVAYHTAQPFRFVVESKPDRDSREAALVDQAFANYLAVKQRLNAVFAEALYLASAYGYAPVHAFWRDDITTDPYEPILHQRDELAAMFEQLGIPMELPASGFIDSWVGDPWDSVFHTGARRNSVQMWSYGRTLPAGLVRAAFAHVPGIETLEGSTKLPTASRFQRIARKWVMGGREVHGSATLLSGEADESDELIALIYGELMAGVDQQWPNGRLTVIALKGSASTDRADAAGGYGEPFILHDGSLPGGQFSATRVYSMSRSDDVLGKPYVADLDDLQIQLNQLHSLVTDFIRRSVRAPLVDTGVVDVDAAFYEEDALLSLDPGAVQKGVLPFYLELPARHIPLLQQEIDRVTETMFRIGGWQAASRGEAQPGDAAAKVVALARADDTIHGPTNARLREAVEDYMSLCWGLMKQYGDVPWLIDITGDELAHLAEPYIDRTKLSDSAPRFRLVSGYGATPEAKGQQLLQLVSQLGSDGEPLMTTRQFRRAWPDESTYPDEDDPNDYRLRRPKVINARLRHFALGWAEKFGQRGLRLDQLPVGSPVVMALAFRLHLTLLQQYPVLMDDEIAAHLEQLATLTQDETEHPLVRQIAIHRQNLYFGWLAQRQAATAAAQAEQTGREAEAKEAGKARGQPADQKSKPSGGNSAGGTATSDSAQQASREVPGLTAKAKQGATS